MIDASPAVGSSAARMVVDRRISAECDRRDLGQRHKSHHSPRLLRAVYKFVSKSLGKPPGSPVAPKRLLAGPGGFAERDCVLTKESVDAWMASCATGRACRSSSRSRVHVWRVRAGLLLHDVPGRQPRLHVAGCAMRRPRLGAAARLRSFRVGVLHVHRWSRDRAPLLPSKRQSERTRVTVAECAGQSDADRDLHGLVRCDEDGWIHWPERVPVGCALSSVR